MVSFSQAKVLEPLGATTVGSQFLEPDGIFNTPLTLYDILCLKMEYLGVDHIPFVIIYK